MANKTIIKQKEVQVTEASQKMLDSKVIVAFEYQGLTVESFETLRKSVRSQGGEIVVLKNNISRRAASKNGHEKFAELLVGPKAILFSKNNIVEPAKALYDFAKKNNKVVVAGGIVEGADIDSAKFAELATLPSYETLLTQLAAGMLGTLSQLGVGLQQIIEKMEKAN